MPNSEIKIPAYHQWLLNQKPSLSGKAVTTQTSGTFAGQILENVHDKMDDFVNRSTLTEPILREIRKENPYAFLHTEMSMEAITNQKMTGQGPIRA